jgi:hypothetical protein
MSATKHEGVMMKKVILLALAGVAMIGLSGCNTEGLQGNISKVDINDLARNGYAIYANGSKRKQVVIDFCADNHYFYFRGGVQVEDGDYYISNGEITISMKAASNTGSTRIDTDDGYLHTSTTYRVEGIEDIAIYEISNNPKCDY